RLPYRAAPTARGCNSLPGADSVAELTAILGIRIGATRLAAGTYAVWPSRSNDAMSLAICRQSRAGEILSDSNLPLMIFR
ncbi:MAG: hypothetical protein ACREL5_09145, partial [Gemmatimonadales bacterium]